MSKFFFTILLSVFLVFPVSAQEIKIEVPVMPRPYSISHNVAFVVDASSTMTRSAEMSKKWQMAWDTIVNLLSSDDLYVRTYIFHDLNDNKRTKWQDFGGPLGFKKFKDTKKWILENKGIRSWGLVSLRQALKDKNPLDKNNSTNKRLTVILLTDGGFSEAAGPEKQSKKMYAKAEKLARSGQWGMTGSFKIFDKVIAECQKWRKKKGLDPATIVSIGIQNDDPSWGTSVKRPDKECQKWLKKIGKKYNGGYVYVKRKEKKKKKAKE